MRKPYGHCFCTCACDHSAAHAAHAAACAPSWVRITHDALMCMRDMQAGRLPAPQRLHRPHRSATHVRLSPSRTHKLPDACKLLAAWRNVCSCSLVHL